MHIQVTPVAKPRMTQSDKWKTRPVVLKYRAFKDEMRLKAPELQGNVNNVLWLVYILPMPKSWSKKKRLAMVMKPHQQTPDIDNITKAFLDATMSEDKAVYELHAMKLWGVKGGIIYGEEDYGRVSKTPKIQEKGEIPTPPTPSITPTTPRRPGGQGSIRMRGVLPRVRRGKEE